MKRCLVTGAYGLVGSAIRQALDALNYPNVLCPTKQEVNWLDKEAAKNYLERHQPEWIIHCAARVGGLFGNMNYPATMMRENLTINMNLFDGALSVRQPKILAFLSSCIFPHQATYPLNVSSLHDGPPHDSNFAYAHAKRMLDIQAKAYRREFGLVSQLAVLTNVFGPHDYFNLERSHVVPALIHKVYRAKLSGEPLVVAGSGKPLREFTFSGDIARLSVWALECYNSQEPVFFSSGEETSIAELVEAVVRLMKFDGKIIFDTSKPDGQYRKPTDASVLKAAWPDFKFTPLREALSVTVEWFLRSYPHVRL